jgi:hypothetical protein
MNAEELERWRRSLEAALSKKVDYENAKESLANLAGTVEAFLSVLRSDRGLVRPGEKELRDMPDDDIRYITTKEILARAHKKGLQTTKVTVIQKCQTLGIPKTTGIYLLTDKEAEALLSQLRGKRGRPSGPQPWIEQGISRQHWYWLHDTAAQLEKKKAVEARLEKQKQAKRKKEEQLAQAKLAKATLRKQHRKAKARLEQARQAKRKKRSSSHKPRFANKAQKSEA